VVVVVSDHVRRQPSKLPEIVVLSLSALVGFVVDTAFLRFGVFRIPRTMFAPPWLVALWPSFATTTATSGPLSGLRGRPRLSVLFGAVGGPLAYAAGAHWRAIELSGHRAVALAAIGVVWGVFVPALIALRTWEST
jgi:hypothetical protein